MAEIYVARKNDCMASIAKKFGFGDYKIIYDHPQNAGLKRNRPEPNLLVEGDQVYIPDKNLGEESCATEAKHSFQIKQPKVRLRVVLKDDKGEFFGDKKYELTIGKDLFEGNTDARGFIEQEIPADARHGKLKLFTEDEKLKVLTWDLSLGGLDPVETDLGVQARLKNLGFYFGTVNGRLEDRPTKAAVENYQGKHGMEKTGTVDGALRGRLRDAHDKKS